MVTIRSILQKTPVAWVLSSIALWSGGPAGAATPYHQGVVKGCSSGTCTVPFDKLPSNQKLRIEHVSCLLEQIPDEAQMLWGQVSAAPTRNGVAASFQWLAAPAGAERSPDIVISQPTLFFVPPSQYPRITVSLSASFQSMSCTITGYLLAAD